MRCIVIDDEPLARQGMELLIAEIPDLEKVGTEGGSCPRGRGGGSLRQGKEKAGSGRCSIAPMRTTQAAFWNGWP